MSGWHQVLVVRLHSSKVTGIQINLCPPLLPEPKQLVGSASNKNANLEVRDFLVRLGVEQIDGLAFFTNVLLPVLTQSHLVKTKAINHTQPSFEPLQCEDLVISLKQLLDSYDHKSWSWINHVIVSILQILLWKQLEAHQDSPTRNHFSWEV